MTFVSMYNLQSLVLVCWLLFLYCLNVYHSVFSIYNSGWLLWQTAANNSVQNSPQTTYGDHEGRNDVADRNLMQKLQNRLHVRFVSLLLRPDCQ